MSLRTALHKIVTVVAANSRGDRSQDQLSLSVEGTHGEWRFALECSGIKRTENFSSMVHDRALHLGWGDCDGQWTLRLMMGLVYGDQKSQPNSIKPKK